jgi:hypothetical protein
MSSTPGKKIDPPCLQTDWFQTNRKKAGRKPGLIILVPNKESAKRKFLNPLKPASNQSLARQFPPMDTYGHLVPNLLLANKTPFF